jgi:hypothetical protein
MPPEIGRQKHVLPHLHELAQRSQRGFTSTKTVDGLSEQQRLKWSSLVRYQYYCEKG